MSSAERGGEQGDPRRPIRRTRALLAAPARGASRRATSSRSAGEKRPRKSTRLEAAKLARAARRRASRATTIRVPCASARCHSTRTFGDAAAFGRRDEHEARRRVDRREQALLPVGARGEVLDVEERRDPALAELVGQRLGEVVVPARVAHEDGRARSASAVTVVVHGERESRRRNRVQVAARPAEYRGGIVVPARQAPRPRSPSVPDVSILICVHGKLALTRRCLDAIAATAPAGRYEVVVVDNASPDGSGDALEALAAVVSRAAEGRPQRREPRLRRRQQPRRRPTRPGTHLVLLNNDTEPQPGWLEALLAIAERDPATGAVGAKLVYPDGRLQEAGGIVFADASGWNYGRGGDPTTRATASCARSTTAPAPACSSRARVWEALGGFDERYAPAYYEDTDLCFAVRERGLKVVYQPAAVIVHHEGATAGTDTASRLQAAPGRQPRALPREVGARRCRGQQPPHTAPRAPREPPRRRASGCSSSTR